MSLTLLYLGLFSSSFLAATLLPGGSEAVLAAVLAGHPERLWPALLWATAGNTLGGMTSYLLGRLLPGRAGAAGLDRVGRYGAPVLLLAWTPVLGDALCVAAGWLRIGVLPAVLFMALGKGARYGAIAAATLRLTA